MAAPALPADIQKLRDQLVRDQAPSARTRTEFFDPAVFVSRHGRPYSSLKLPVSTMKEMRTDALLRFAQLVSRVPIFTGKWRIECASARKAAFVDEALRRIIGRLIMQFYESWNFGWQAEVKQFGLMSPSWTFIDREAEGGAAARPVWDGGPGIPALVWEPFVPLRPESVTPVWTAGGAFNGIALSSTGTTGAYSIPTVPVAADDVIDAPPGISSFFTGDDERRKVDVDHSLWVVNERDSQFGSIWGRSRLSYAYKYWYSYEMTLGILNRSVERKGDPTIIVTFPQGSSRINNQDVPNQTIAFDIGNKARSGSVLVVPSEVWGEDTGTSNQSPKWGITYLKAEETFDKLIAVLSYLDTMKIRSMMISELSAFEGSGGTSSRNVAAVTGERSYEAQIFTQTEWDEIINRYMIPQLADANFPELKDEPARKVTQAFGQDEAALAADILRSVANANSSNLPIDLPALLERFQIDALSGDDLAKWERDLVTKAETSTPPPAPAAPGGAAGTTDSGFYYDAPNRIELSTDDALLASLPDTKHYSDRAVLAQTRAVRKVWFDLLTAQYNDFADHVSHVDLADDQARAEKIVGAWRYASAKTQAAVKKLSAALTTIFARAGAIELSASKIDPKVFDPNDETMATWVKDNVAAMVRSVEDTTRAQLATRLTRGLERGDSADRIANDLRAHFAEFPDWRADLIAREETKHFYNAATLFAAASAGTKQVQALDAQKGPTDAECERRNGRLFSIADAWKESAREHVRGTLGWRILPPNVQLSLRYFSREEADGNPAARIDLGESTIHLAEGLAPDVEGEYLDRVISWFIVTH
jgi:SPP1 gp7 family putative phage head morphogenesis protein